MKKFRKALNRCGLSDFGFIRPRFTWCNGRLGDQRTLLHLDRMLANDEWIEMFPKAKVHHVSMSASNHYFLAMLLKKKQHGNRGKKLFSFEAMWTREEECKEIIELAWDPYMKDSFQPIQERLERCQQNLQCWNQNGFGNVYNSLKQKQTHL